MTSDSTPPEPKDRLTISDHQAALILHHRLLTTLPPANATDEDVSAWAADMAEWAAGSGQPNLLWPHPQDFVPQPVKNFVVEYAITPAERATAAVGKEVHALEDKVNGIEKNIVNALHKAVFDQVANAETSVTKLFTDFTEPVRKRVKGVLDLLEVAREFEKNEFLEARTRLKWVGNALAFLLNNKEVKLITNVFSDLMKPGIGIKDAGKDLGKLIEHLMVDLSPPLKAIEWVVDSIKNGLSIPKLGFGLTPGRLHEFLNDEQLKEGERDFRIELVSALDRYFHGEYETPGFPAPAGHLPRSPRSVDGKLAIQTLTDLCKIIVQTSFGFVFRLPNLPSLTAPKISLMQQPKHLPDSSAVHASVTMSRSLAHPVKALSGLLLRGFWEVSSHNDALVETLASTLAHTIGSLLESILYSLLSLVEIHEVYDDPSKNNRCLVWWATRAQWGKDKKKTYQAVVVKKGMLGDEAKENKLAGIIKEIFKRAEHDKRVSLLETLLKDYGAYLELSMVCHEPDMTDQSIVVTAVPQKNGEVAVDAEFKDPDHDLPIVLRAYAAGQHTIMLRESDNQYHAVLPKVGSDPVKVHVLAGTTAHGSCPQTP